MKTSHIEILEPRIAPAILINPTTVTYSDLDGDDVTIKLSKPLFTAGNLPAALNFLSLVARPDGSIPQQLTNLNVDALGATSDDHLGITISAKRSAIHGGNAYAHVEHINASIDLGAVKVQGDLAQIDAGDATIATTALKSLTVASFGQQATAQNSDIQGPIGTITIRGNMVGELLQTGVDAGIASLTIGGSLGNGANTVGAGHIVTAGTIARLTIGHDIIGGLADSGNITGKIGKLTVGGSIFGGTGANSGTVLSTQLGSATIAGSVIGGAGAAAGTIILSGGTTTSLKIGGSLIGNDTADSGFIQTGAGLIKSLTILGSVIGGEAVDTGKIEGHFDKIVVGGDLVGKAFANTGAIISDGSIASIQVKGSLLGRTGGIQSGSIIATTGSIGSILIGGDVLRADIIAGISPGADALYGIGDGANADIDNQPGVVNRIGSLTIKGAVFRTTGTFAFEANEIGKVKIGTINYTHTDPTLNFATGFTVDNDGFVRVREI